MEVIRSNSSTRLRPVLPAEKIIIYSGLFLSTGAVIPLVQEESGIARDMLRGDIAVQTVWMGLYVAALLFLFFYRENAGLRQYPDKAMLLLLGWTLISALWSVVPGLTLRRSVACICTAAFGIYLASVFTLERLVFILTRLFGLIAVLSLITVLLFPSYGIHHDIHYGAWRGIFVHKNQLGQIMAFSVPVWFIHILDRTGGSRLAGLAFCGFSLLLLLLSTSKTALVAMILTLCVLLAYRLARRGSLPAASAFLMIVLAGGSGIYWTAGNIGTVIAALGRDLTFTGRTHIWREVWGLILQRPWLGYGYGAFWLSQEVPVFIREVVNSHNAYLDLWLSLGFIGLLLFLASLASNLRRAVALSGRRTDCASLFPLAVLIFQVVYNIPEISFVVQNSFFLILYTAISVLCGKESENADITV